MLLYVYEAEDPYVLGRAFQDTDHLPVHSFMKYEAEFFIPKNNSCMYQQYEKTLN